MRIIIVGKSCYSCFQKLYVPEENDYLIGLDEGALTILKSGYTPNEVWGDFDNKAHLQEILDKVTNVHLFKVEKNETDLELVLMNLNTTSEVLIYDATSGRIDHELINILLLRKYKDLKLKLVDEFNEITYLSKPCTYHIKQGSFQYCSIITLDEATISIIKAKYLATCVKITKSDTYTTSNNYVDSEFVFELLSGEVYLIRSI